jgi:hypothetical protein
VLISALFAHRKIRSFGIVRGAAFVVQARKELPSAVIRLRGYPRSAESGLRWSANHCNMERF